MKCHPELIEAYVDNEVDAGMKAQVEEHMAECAPCAEARTRLLERRKAIRSTVPYYRAPENLRQAILKDIRQASPDEKVVPLRTTPWRSLAIAASVLLSVSVAWNVTHMRSNTQDRDALAESILSSHVTSLIGTHLLDVVSTDQHTVKPWFNGKLDFSPTVTNLEKEGFPLAGGRIEYLGGHQVAAMVYRRRQHVVNLYVWPSEKTDPAESRFSRKGFNELEWTDSSMTHWAVSDISFDELQEFKKLLTK
jgi:anti-sigma factor RsiW